MNFKEHRKGFNKRWNITSSDTPEQAFRKFKQRILNIFKHIDGMVTEESALKFCQYYGIEDTWTKYRDQKGREYRRKTTIIDGLKSVNKEKELYRLIEIILYLDIKDSVYLGRKMKLSLTKNVKEAIEMSDINLTISESENGIILYPKGEKKLDEELVNKSLSFLNEESNKHFEDALKFYQNKSHVKSSESLRRSLEEFLRFKLENQKGLDKNIETLRQKLKQGGNQPEIRNIIFQTFDYLDKYFNEHSKHGDGNIKEPENEFLIYQTGLLLRYINKM